MSYFEEAKRKLDEGVKANLAGNKENAMKKAVRDALLEFCLQDEEFAQAVAQGGSFADCMTAVAKGVGSSISDMEAYGKAVKFYFPGAGIQVKMTIDLCASVRDNKPMPSKGSVVVDLTSFF